MSLKALLLKNKKSAFLYMLGALLTSGNNLLFTLGLSYAFNIFRVESVNQALQVGLISVGIMMIPTILQVGSRFLRIGFMTDILKEVRLMAYDKIMGMDSESFKLKSKQDYQSQLISDINLFEKDFFLSLLNIIFAVVSTILSVIVLSMISWVIALICVITSIILYLITKVYEKPVRNKRKETQEENKIFNQSVSNLVMGAKTLKHYAQEKMFSKKFNEDVVDLETVKADYFKLNKNQQVISESIAMFSQILTFAIATYLLAIGNLEVPALIIVLNLTGQIVWVMIMAFSFVNRIKSSIDIYNSLVSLPSNNQEYYQPVSGIDFKVNNLSYAYDMKKVLDDIHLSINKNEKILIHGPSGSGKTTFLNCLSQNLRGYEGSIQMGDSELNTIDHKDFLSHSAYIRQSHFMFEDTIKNNIVLNQPFDKEKFENILKQSALFDWIETLDDKENHVLIQNGSNVSGGQRQRISIARELYAAYDIIFIDEPSASLDDENAEVIYDTILNLDKTVICVTHRHLDYLKS
ncbi:MAG TPA: ABC transporter ATP-binding protein, partial [Erysipelothrix sp.]|nr:ABC transporter ATP-binding protein [Erysipelothrix sp.]